MTISFRRFIAGGQLLNESLGNLNRITDSTAKHYVKEVLKFMKGQLYANGFSPNSQISQEFSCKVADVPTELKRRSTVGNIAGIIVKANGNVGIAVFDASDRISPNSLVRVFGGYKGYNASKGTSATLNATLKYFNETPTLKLKQSDVKDADVSITIVYADMDAVQKVVNRRENKNTDDEYALDSSGTETRFMRGARAEANKRRILNLSKNLSVRDPLLYSKLVELYDTTDTLVGPDVVIDGTEYSQLRIPRVPELEVVNKIPQVTVATFNGHAVVIRPDGYRIVRR